MARGDTYGFEWLDFDGPALGEDLDAHGSGFTFDQTVNRLSIGRASGKFDSGAGAAAPSLSIGVPANGDYASALTYYHRCYFRFTNLPASTVTIFGEGFSAASAIKLTSTGVVQLFDQVANTQIGSNGPTLSADGATWYRLEISITTNGSGVATSSTARVDGTDFASGAVSAVSATTFYVVGWQASPGANKILHVDDTAINNSSGSDQNSWPGSGKVVLLVPVSDNAVGTNWQKPGGATTNLFSSLDNLPPTGVADSTSSGNAEKQIRHATNSSTTSYDANLTTYTTAGVGSSDTVNLIRWYVISGSASNTSPPSREAQLVSNPSEGAATSCGTPGLVGTYPSGWTGKLGPIIYSPSVTKGNSPVLRIHRVTSSTRIVDVAQMAAMIDFTPAASSNTYTKAGYGKEHG